MGFFETSTRGLKETDSFLTDLRDEVRQGTTKRLKQASILVAGTAKHETHSRRVAAAMSYDVNVRSSTDFQARIGPSQKKAWFAHFLEFGTVHSRKFPFLAPTIKKVLDRVVELVGVPSILRGPRSASGTSFLLQKAA